MRVGVSNERLSSPPRLGFAAALPASRIRAQREDVRVTDFPARPPEATGHLVERRDANPGSAQLLSVCEVEYLAADLRVQLAQPVIRGWSDNYGVGKLAGVHTTRRLALDG